MPDQPTWTLRVADEAGVVRTVPLDAAAYLLGRSGDAEIRLDRQTVSRRHARLWRDETGRWHIADLGSRGGVLVNGRPATQAPLGADDQVTISRFRLRLLPPAARGQASSPSLLSWSDAVGGSDLSVLTDVTPPRLDASHIAQLHRFGRALLEADDPAERIAMLCREICGPTIRARWAMALELDPDDPNRPPRPLALAPEGINAAQDLHLSRTTIRAMRDAAAPVLASNFGPGGDAVEMSVVADAPATAAVACPLGDAASGYRLVYANLPPAMGSIEWLALIALAAKQYEQAEASWQAREAAQARAAVERDMDNARRIQESILPPPFASDGLEVAWHFDPCDAVGGDLVDVFRLPDGRVLLTVADVTGHGLPAALTTLSVHSILHTCARTRLPPADLAATLNEYLEAHLPDGRFVTMALIAMDPATGALEYINAGHPLPLVRRADGSARGLSPAGSLPLGIMPGPYAPAHDTLEPGEVMLLVSDGLTELRIADGSMLGPAGVDAMLTEALSRNGESLEQAAAALKRALDDCRLDQAMLDDETFLLVRRS